MRWLFDFLNSSIGKKVTVGLAGLLLCGFLLTHLAGNLILFAGQAKFNAYAEFLEKNPLLPALEIGLAALFLIHIIVTLYARWQNWQARPVSYEMTVSKGGRTWGSRTMTYTAFLLLGFIILHVATLKYGLATSFTEDEVFQRVMTFLKSPWMAGFYVLTMAGLGLHLSHGFESAFQTLGVNHPKYTPVIKAAGILFAVAVAGTFAVIPLWAYWQGGLK